MNTNFSLVPFQVSRPHAVPPGAIVTVTPAAGATAKVEYTKGSQADIINGVATWSTWAKGSVTAATSDQLGQAAFVRVTAMGGFVAVSINPNPTAAESGALLTTDWGTPSSGGSPAAAGSDLSLTGNAAPGGVLTAAYAKGSGTIMFTRTPAAGGATVDIGSAVASGSTYTVQISDMGYVIGARPVTYLPPAASGSKVQVTPALRPVTDRGALPNVISSSTTLNYVQARTAHIAHDKITAPVVEWTLASPQGSSENPSVATGTLLSSSIEYPAGTFTQLTYSGSVTAAMDGVSILSSDAKALPVAIPDGATFWVWIYMQNTSTNRTYYDDGMFGSSNTSGEVGKYGATALTDYTMTGGLTNPGATTGTTFRPVCIRDISSKLTAYVMGDSRQRKTQGVYGHTDTKGRQGEAHRAVGARMAMINGAVSGDSYAYITAANAYNVRKMLADRCDIIIDEYGINDLGTAATVTLTQFAGWINTMRALLGPTKPYFRQTVTPRSPSSNYFVDTGGQTPQSNTPSRTEINDAIRNNTLALNNPMAGYFETADAVETARNSGYIKTLSNRLITDITVSALSTTVNAATARFSASDVGRMLFASSNNFTALITGYVSPTQVTINLSQPTAIAAGDSVYVGMPTKDGLHYWPEAEILMAADPSWNQLGAAAY